MSERAWVSRLGSRNEGRQAYLSGPMRGYPEYNFPAFLQAGEKLTAKGYLLFNPAENDMRNGFDPGTGRYADGRTVTIREVILDDLMWICQYADVVVVLPGWEESLGADAEVATAKAAGVPVLTLEEALDAAV